MIQNVVSVSLPVGENLTIKKKRITPLRGAKPDDKRISIVTGVHGDELEGQYVCWLVQKRINENIADLDGIVDIYPAMNPLGIDSITRGIPGFDLDMNRIFPGYSDGTMTEHIASEIISDIAGSSACIDIHASNIYLTEVPQVRINEISRDTLIPLAKHLNVDFIWVHASATVLESTLAYSLNEINVPTLVVEMGVGMRITKSYCEQLADGIFSLMAELGIWKGAVSEPRTPIISRDSKVNFINAAAAGLFVPSVKHWTKLKKDDPVGMIVNPLSGAVLDNILSPCDGILFTLREYPIVDEGSLIARILEDNKEAEQQ